MTWQFFAQEYRKRTNFEEKKTPKRECPIVFAQQTKKGKRFRSISPWRQFECNVKSARKQTFPIDLHFAREKDSTFDVNCYSRIRNSLYYVVTVFKNAWNLAKACIYIMPCFEFSGMDRFRAFICRWGEGKKADRRHFWFFFPCFLFV